MRPRIDFTIGMSGLRDILRKKMYFGGDWIDQFNRNGERSDWNKPKGHLDLTLKEV